MSVMTGTTGKKQIIYECAVMSTKGLLEHNFFVLVCSQITVNLFTKEHLYLKLVALNVAEKCVIQI